MTSILGALLVVTFFVISSDPGSLVIDILTAKDGDEPPVWQRVFRAVSEGVVAASNGNWQQRLDALVTSPQRQHVDIFMRDVVQPAMRKVAKQFEAREMATRVAVEDDRCYIEVDHGAEIDFVYGCAPAALPRRRSISAPSRASRRWARSVPISAPRSICMKAGSSTTLSATARRSCWAILDQYEKHLHFLYLLRATA